jgi:hypothetical protein
MAAASVSSLDARLNVILARSRIVSWPTLERRPLVMNDPSTPKGQPAAVSPPGKLAYATPATAPLVAGRRSFFRYRDLGVTAASSGKMRAQVTIGADGTTL